MAPLNCQRAKFLRDNSESNDYWATYLNNLRHSEVDYHRIHYAYLVALLVLDTVNTTLYNMRKCVYI